MKTWKLSASKFWGILCKFNEELSISPTPDSYSWQVVIILTACSVVMTLQGTVEITGKKKRGREKSVLYRHLCKWKDMLFFNKQTNQLEMDPFKRNPSRPSPGGGRDEMNLKVCSVGRFYLAGWLVPTAMHLSLGSLASAPSVLPCRWGWGVERWAFFRGGCECQSQNFRGPLSRLTPCSPCSEGNQEAVLEQSTVTGEDPDRCGVHRRWQRVLICGNEHGVLEDSNSNGATLLEIMKK